MFRKRALQALKLKAESDKAEALASLEILLLVSKPVMHITIRTRLLGVDTPERGHEDWAKATSECRRLLLSVAESRDGSYPDWVKIKTEKTGKYGRWLVQIDGVTDELAKIWPYGG